MSHDKEKVTTIEIEFPNPPFELDNLVALSYDTKKLSTYLDFLNENDVKFNDDIENLNTKTSCVETMKGQIEEIHTQQDILQGKLFEVIKQTNQNNVKIGEIGQQLRNHEDRIHNQENENKLLKKKVGEQESDIKFLMELQQENSEKIAVIYYN